MEYLAIQFPNKEAKIYKGEWQQVELSNLPENHFFITDFTKELVYFFVISEEVLGFSNQDLTFREDDEVFVVNGRYYLNGLQFFIDGFEDNDIEKAIYSRIKTEDRGGEELIDVFRKLASRYQEQALVYLASSKKFGTWMGATPEILISGDAERLFSMALAGTKVSEEVEWTDKEREEHQFVVDHVKKIVENQHAEGLQVFPTTTVKNGAVYHLRTNYEFSLPSTKWNQLMMEMHPTPAVCGTPTEEAKEYILKLEPHDREFYTGLIGWRGAEDINVYVNLRCMQVLESSYALYVGGGITLDSDIGNEWQETEAKSNTLLEVIRKE